jgi:uncharacterized protein (DUF1800 family)
MRIAGGRIEARSHSPRRLLRCFSVDALRTGLVCALCVLMVDQPMLGASGPKRGPTAGGQQVKGESRALHALNRLTFGPRPGDVEAVEQMGLSNWFQLQLNPGKIDDSALNARLAMFPAMQLPQNQLMARYPTQQVIRQMARQQAFAPSDPVEHAIYADQVAFYKVQQENKAAKDAATAQGSAPSGMGEDSAAGAAPVERRPAGQAAGGDAAPDYAAMAAGMDGSNGQAALPKDALTDGAPAPAEHVEKLYKDLEAEKILSLPPDDRMRKVIGMQATDFVAFRESLSAREVGEFVQGLSPIQREIFAAMQNSTRMVSSEELQERMIRDIYSNRQLEAVMTDFWLNHFNVYIRKNQNEPYLIPAYERDVIRPHALGKFEDLLVATAESPAMLMYLDNWQSVGPDSQAAKNGPRFARFAQNPQVKAALKDRGLNENYGRELMELHTLGVNGGYTQKDVTEVAKVFTGWTMTPPAQGAEFQFDERKHEPGSKTVLGQTIHEAGMKEGLEVLHMLATSPATAHFVSTKLAVRFVSDDPPPALVDRMAQSFLSSDGDIKTVLRTMFESPEFWSNTTERAKVKTPEEFVISAVRASGAQVNNAQGLVQALDRLGMPLYGMQTPNGYSWMSEPWVSTGQLVNRMNFALVLTGDRLPGVRTDWTRLLGEPAGVRKQVDMETTGDGLSGNDLQLAAKERKLEMILLEQPLSEKMRMAVIGQSNDENAAVQAAKEFEGGGGKGAGAKAGALAGEYDPLLPPGVGGMPPQKGPAAQDDVQAAVMAGLLLGSPEFQRR